MALNERTSLFRGVRGVSVQCKRKVMDSLLELSDANLVLVDVLTADLTGEGDVGG
jgi:hypothetical protein